MVVRRPVSRQLRITRVQLGLGSSRLLEVSRQRLVVTQFVDGGGLAALARLKKLGAQDLVLRIERLFFVFDPGKVVLHRLQLEFGLFRQGFRAKFLITLLHLARKALEGPLLIAVKPVDIIFVVKQHQLTIAVVVTLFLLALVTLFSHALNLFGGLLKFLLALRQRVLDGV